jgi:hypothetical protein
MRNLTSFGAFAMRTRARILTSSTGVLPEEELRLGFLASTLGRESVFAATTQAR